MFYVFALASVRLAQLDDEEEEAARSLALPWKLLAIQLQLQLERKKPNETNGDEAAPARWKC